MFKIRITNLLLLFLLIPSVSMPMHKIGPLLQRASVLGAGLWGSGLLGGIYHLLGKGTEVKVRLEEAPENVKNWLREKGLPKDSSIQIKMADAKKIASLINSHATYINQYNFIVLTQFPPFAVNREQNQSGVTLKGTWKKKLSAPDIAKADFIEIDLPTALSYHEQLTQMNDDGDVKKQALDKIGEKINCYKAIIQHEEAHAQQLKFFAHKYRSYITPFLTSVPFMILFTKFINPVLNKNLCGRLISPLLAFLGSQISNCCLSYPWTRYLEKKADDAIENDPSVLLAFKKYFENIENANSIQHSGKDYTISSSGIKESEIKSVYISNSISKLARFIQAIGDLKHPTLDYRIKRIDQRLARISENSEK